MSCTLIDHEIKFKSLTKTVHLTCLTMTNPDSGEREFKTALWKIQYKILIRKRINVLETINYIIQG